MKGAVIFRLICIVALWVIFCGWLIVRYQEAGVEWNLRTIFPIVASGIIVFVPLYKKYIKNGNGK